MKTVRLNNFIIVNISFLAEILHAIQSYRKNIIDILYEESESDDFRD
jgi:hypothetical protein